MDVSALVKEKELLAPFLVPPSGTNLVLLASTTTGLGDLVVSYSLCQPDGLTQTHHVCCVNLATRKFKTTITRQGAITVFAPAAPCSIFAEGDQVDVRLLCCIETQGSNMGRLALIDVPSLNIITTVTSVVCQGGEFPIPCVLCAATVPVIAPIMVEGIDDMTPSMAPSMVQHQVSFEHWLGCSDGSVLIIDAACPGTPERFHPRTLLRGDGCPVISLVATVPFSSTPAQIPGVRPPASHVVALVQRAGSLSLTVFEALSRRKSAELSRRLMESVMSSATTVLAGIITCCIFYPRNQQILCGRADGCIVSLDLDGRTTVTSVAPAPITQIFVASANEVAAVSAGVDSLGLHWLSGTLQPMTYRKMPTADIIIQNTDSRSIEILAITSTVVTGFFRSRLTIDEQLLSAQRRAPMERTIAQVPVSEWANPKRKEPLVNRLIFYIIENYQDADAAALLTHLRPALRDPKLMSRVTCRAAHKGMGRVIQLLSSWGATFSEYDDDATLQILLSRAPEPVYQLIASILPTNAYNQMTMDPYGRVPLHYLAATHPHMDLHLDDSFTLTRDSIGITPTHIAALFASEGIVEQILPYMTEDSLCSTQFRLSLLHFAVIGGSLPICCSIIGRFPQTLSMADTFGRTPLHMAAELGRTKLLSALAAAAIRLDPKTLVMKDVFGRTVLELSIHCADAALFRDLALIVGRISPESVGSPEPAIALINVLTARAEDPLRRLINEILPGDPLVAIYPFPTPTYPSRAALLSVLKECLVAGCNPLANTGRGSLLTKLLSAYPSMPELEEPIRMLTQRYVLPQYTRVFEPPSLAHLLARSAHATQYSGEQVLNIAAIGQSSLLADILDIGISINSADSLSRTLAHSAVLRGDHDLLSRIIDLGVDPSNGDDQGMTPLHMAALMNDREAAETLISSGAVPNVVNSLGFTPFDYSSLALADLFDTSQSFDETAVHKRAIRAQSREIKGQSTVTFGKKNGVLAPLRVRPLPGPPYSVVSVPALGQFWLFTAPSWSNDALSMRCCAITVSTGAVLLDTYLSVDRETTRVAAIGPYVCLWSSADAAAPLIVVDGRDALPETGLYHKHTVQGTEHLVPVHKLANGQFATVVNGEPQEVFQGEMALLLQFRQNGVQGEGVSLAHESPFVTATGQTVHFTDDGYLCTATDGAIQKLEETTARVLSPDGAELRVVHLSLGTLSSPIAVLTQVAPVAQNTPSGRLSHVASAVAQDGSFIGIAIPDQLNDCTSVEIFHNTPTQLRDPVSIRVSQPPLLRENGRAIPQGGCSALVLTGAGRLAAIDLASGKTSTLSKATDQFSLASYVRLSGKSSLLSRVALVLRKNSQQLSLVDITSGVPLWSVSVNDIFRTACANSDNSEAQLILHNISEGSAYGICRFFQAVDGMVLLFIDILPKVKLPPGMPEPPLPRIVPLDPKLTKPPISATAAMHIDTPPIRHFAISLMIESSQPVTLGLLQVGAGTVVSSDVPVGFICPVIHLDGYLRFWHIRGESLVHQAAAHLPLILPSPPPDVALSLLSSNHFDMDQVSLTGDTPLFSALLSGVMSSVTLLVSRGAQLQHRNGLGITLLEVAALSGLSGAVPLLASLFDAQTKTINGVVCLPPVHNLAVCGLKAALNLVLQASGARAANSDDGRHWTPLHALAAVRFQPLENFTEHQRLAFEQGQMHIFRRRCAKMCGDGRSLPLSVLPDSMTDDVASIADSLLENGAEPTAQNEEGDTPLHIAAQHGNMIVGLALVNVLLKDKHTARDGAGSQQHSADLLSAPNRNQNTPLHAAVKGGNRDIARLLVENGASPNKTNFDGQTPIHIASAMGDTQMLETLAQSAMQSEALDWNIQDREGNTALHMAIRSGNTDCVRFIVARGADPNMQSPAVGSSLHLAASMNNIELIKLLVQSGALIHLLNTQSMTPLDLADSNSRVVMIRSINQKLSWMPNKTLDCCSVCREPFTISKRRHHCRLCARLVCNSCARNMIPLPQIGESTPQRICIECYNALQSNEEPITARDISSEGSSDENQNTHVLP